MSINNVSTKINKSERINLRCTKAFKASLDELCTKKGVKITDFILNLCAQEISKYISPVEKAETVLTNKKNPAKPRYMWITPVGSFDNRGDAEKATGLKTYTLTKKCDDQVDGFSRELI